MGAKSEMTFNVGWGKSSRSSIQQLILLCGSSSSRPFHGTDDAPVNDLFVIELRISKGREDLYWPTGGGFGSVRQAARRHQSNDSKHD